MAVRSETQTRGEGEDLCYYEASSLTAFNEERARARKGQLGRGKGKQPRGIPTGCGWHLSLKFSTTAGGGKVAVPMPSVSHRDSGSFLQVVPRGGKGTNHGAMAPPPLPAAEKGKKTRRENESPWERGMIGTTWASGQGSSWPPTQDG